MPPARRFNSSSLQRPYLIVGTIGGGGEVCWLLSELLVLDDCPEDVRSASGFMASLAALPLPSPCFAAASFRVIRFVGLLHPAVGLVLPALPLLQPFPLPLPLPLPSPSSSMPPPSSAAVWSCRPAPLRPRRIAGRCVGRRRWPTCGTPSGACRWTADIRWSRPAWVMVWCGVVWCGVVWWYPVLLFGIIIWRLRTVSTRVESRNS